MYKILVADDEVLERTALKKTLEKHYQASATVTMAANGQQAIELSEKLRIDIVLMDIEMPGVNGLEAARIIKQMLPRCRILILTAYQRFQYAQEAIGIGADDYLLKPVSDQELIQKIDKIMADVNKDRNNLERSRQLDQLTKEQFVLSVISGYSNETSLKNQLKDLSIGFSYGFFMVLKGEKTHSAEKLQEMVEPFLGLWENGNLLTYEYDEILLIAVIMNGAYQDAQWIVSKAALLLKQAEKSNGDRLFIGIGDGASTLSEMRASYELARTAISRATAQNRIIMGAGQPSDTREGLEERLYHLLLDKDLDGALKLIDIALDTLTFGAASAQDAIKTMDRLLNGILLRLNEDTRIADATPINFSAIKKEAYSRMEWSMAVRTLLSNWIKAADAQQGPHIQSVKQEIERYLQHNYFKDLSIGQAARDMHYSEPYFSKLFTRCFQRNFLSYLTDLRLKIAVDMLADPSANIREIGMAVGYEDPNYFAKVFKKAYGLSPSDFRRKRAARKEGEYE